MITKQELINHVKQIDGDFVYFSNIEQIFKTVNIPKIIKFTKGALYIETDLPRKFSNVEDLTSILKSLTLGDTITVGFDTVSKPNAIICLIVIKIFTEVLGYKIKKITASKVDFVK